jgi:TPR repeat protein
MSAFSRGRPFGEIRLLQRDQARHDPVRGALGEAYLQGRGVDADPVEACKWYTLAAERDYTSAKKALAALETGLQPEQIAEGKARAFEWRRSRQPSEAK